MIVAGTRPEFIKLLPVIHAVEATGRLRARFCHTGQHEDLGAEILQAGRLVPDERLARPAAGDVAALLSGLVGTIGGAIDRQAPRAVVVQGDTASALAGALAAFHRQIPVAHVEAGLRSGDLAHPFPEEGYRRTISALAHWHFPPTAAACATLCAEGHDRARIEQTGNTVIDALHWAAARLDADAALGAEAVPLIAGIGDRPLCLATVHRREHDRAALARIAEGLAAIARNQGLHIVLPLHPRPESAVLRERLTEEPNVTLSPALGYFAFVRLMRAARLIVSDSGGIQEEATALGRPVLVLRDVTERPEAVEAGIATLVGDDPHMIAQTAAKVLSSPPPAPGMAFGKGDAGKRIAARLAADLP